LKSPNKSIQKQVPTAIIGMGCFFPKSSGLKQYWRLIAQGKDGITEVPATHWSAEDYYHPDPITPDHVYCKRGGFLSPVMFDPVEFGLPPHTLEATDTSQILGLVAAKMALADAGYGDGGSRKFNRDRTSVILGVTGTQELVIPLSSRLGFPKWRRALEAADLPADIIEKVIEDISQSYVGWQENSFPGLLGNVVAGKICNRLNLGGTNCVVDAACASSMSAIHLAVLELACDRSDMVITGGVDTLNDIFMHMCFAKTQTLSPTGDARPFAENADGTVLGEGIGMLVLKRLPDAQKDGDRIYAVIRALGSASDGKSQSIYAPRVEGQVKALQMAYRNSGVKPSTVDLVEAHGTGTRVGDKVEFNALCQVFDQQSRKGNKIALGSVKSMIGHTKAAAGAAGLIKTALSLYHKILPPTLKVEKPDPDLDMEHSAFYLNTETQPWIKRTRHPRRASVSAFGFGGSNFHLVVEEYQPGKNEISWDGSVEIVAFSGSDPVELTQKLSGLKTALENDVSKQRLSCLAAESRRRFSPRDPYRLLFTLDQSLIESGDYLGLFTDALTNLDSSPQRGNWNITNSFYGEPESKGKLAFIFPGQGSQYIRMARDLVCYFPEALDVIGKANKAFHKDQLLSDFIYPHPPQTREHEKGQVETLIKTEIAQPAIGAISIAMLQILQRFGIRPDATCGHSFGELTALHAAGCFDQMSFLKLAATRGKIMAAVAANTKPAKGAMLAVSAPLDDIKDIIRRNGSDITLANYNSPSQGVLSGRDAAVTNIEKIIHKKGFKTVRLPVSAAFHCPLVGEARKPFLNFLKRIRFHAPDMPVYSNTTAKPYPSDTAEMIELLGNHLLNPVDFVNVVENLYQSGIRTFVEVGPKSILTGLVRSILQGRQFQALSVDRSSGARFGLTDLALTLCQLAASGYGVALDKWESTLTDVPFQGQIIVIQPALQNPQYHSPRISMTKNGTTIWIHLPRIR
jgi:polyketide-type polyunsaturated fatty acid synthase PfaA